MALTRGEQVNVIIISFISIAFIIFLLRMYTRFILMRSAGREDYCLIASMVCAIALTVLIGEQVKYGMGRHIWTLSPATIVKSLKPFWASIWVYNLALSFLKISIFFQYLRIFTTRRFRIICWTVMTLVIIYSFWTFFSSIFICFPIPYFWDKTIKNGKCLNQNIVWFTNAGVNIATDFAAIIMPIPMLNTLSLPRKQKWALMGIFCFGGFGCIVSILRIKTLVAISNSTDPTFDNPPAATWSSLEISVGIICASLPTLKPILAKAFPSFFEATIASEYYPRAGYYRSRSGHGSISATGEVRWSTKITPVRRSGSNIRVIRSERDSARYSSTGDLKFHRHELSELSSIAYKNEPPLEEDKEIQVVTIVEQSIEERPLPPLPGESRLNPLAQNPINADYD